MKVFALLVIIIPLINTLHELDFVDKFNLGSSIFNIALSIISFAMDRILAAQDKSGEIKENAILLGKFVERTEYILNKLSDKLKYIIKHVMAAVSLRVPIQFAMGTIELLNAHYQTYLYYQRHDTFNPMTMTNFANFMLSHSLDSPISLMKRLRHLVFTNGLDGTPNLLIKMRNYLNVEGCTLQCKMRRSGQEILLEFYEQIVLSEVKLSQILIFAHFIRINSTAVNQVTNERMLDQKRLKVLRTVSKDLLTHILAQNDKFIPVYVNTSRAIYNCFDTIDKIKQVGKWSQIVIEREDNLIPVYKCSKNCDEIHEGKINVEKHDGGRPVEKCDAVTDIGPFQDTILIKPTYIYYTSGTTNISKISNSVTTFGVEEETDVSFEQWTSLCPIFIFRLDVCYGACAYKIWVETTDTLADVANNMVITGVQFEVKDRTIYLTIKQGVLQEGGIIDSNSSTWQPKITKNRHYKMIEVGQPTYFYHHTVRVQRENRAITGLRFLVDSNNDRDMVRLQIATTSFDANGKLNISDSSWQDDPLKKEPYKHRNVTYYKKPRSDSEFLLCNETIGTMLPLRPINWTSLFASHYPQISTTQLGRPEGTHMHLSGIGMIFRSAVPFYENDPTGGIFAPIIELNPRNIELQQASAYMKEQLVNVTNLLLTDDY